MSDPRYQSIHISRADLAAAVKAGLSDAEIAERHGVPTHTACELRRSFGLPPGRGDGRRTGRWKNAADWQITREQLAAHVAANLSDGEIGDLYGVSAMTVSAVRMSFNLRHPPGWRKRRAAS